MHYVSLHCITMHYKYTCIFTLYYYALSMQYKYTCTFTQYYYAVQVHMHLYIVLLCSTSTHASLYCIAMHILNSISLYTVFAMHYILNSMSLCTVFAMHYICFFTLYCCICYALHMSLYCCAQCTVCCFTVLYTVMLYIH